MLSVKQGGIKYHFLSPWYDSTWDWTLVSLAIGKWSSTTPMDQFLKIVQLEKPFISEPLKLYK